MFIFEEMEGVDRLYMVMRFQEQLQQQLKIATMLANEPDREQKVSFDELLTKMINAKEHTMGSTNALTSLFVNHDFDTSFMITST